MTRLPEALPLLVPSGPDEVAAAVLGRDLGDGLGLLDDTRLRSVKLEKQRRCDCVREAGAAVHGVELDLVEELDPGYGDPELDRLHHALHGSRDGRERAHRGGDRLRSRIDAQRHVDDDPERSLRSDEEPRQVVARRRLPGPRSGSEHTALRRYDGQRQDVLAHRPVPHCSRARRTRGDHASDGGVGARVDREEDAVGPQQGVELLAGDPGLDRRVHVLDADAHDPVHLREIDADTAAKRSDMALERCSGAERNEGNARPAADVDDGDDVLGRSGIDHEVGRRRAVPGLVRAVLTQDVGTLRDTRLAEHRDEVGPEPFECRRRDGHRRIVPDRSRLRCGG